MLTSTVSASNVSETVVLDNSLTLIAQEIHADNVAKGFYDDEKILNEILQLNLAPEDLTNPVTLPFIQRMTTMARIMLINTELAEAVEGIRKNQIKGAEFDIRSIAFADDMSNEAYASLYKSQVKDSFEAELAGTFIRLMDLCGNMGVDIEGYVKAELRFNRTRAYKHGKNS